MEEISSQLWIEPIGGIIIARLRGVPTEEILKTCHQKILSLVKDTRQGRILYDCLELEAPEVNVPLSQWDLDNELKDKIKLRRAVVVPNTKIAYLGRLAFNDEEVRVFYNDMISAMNWLVEAPIRQDEPRP